MKRMNQEKEREWWATKAILDRCSPGWQEDPLGHSKRARSKDKQASTFVCDYALALLNEQLSS